VNPHVTLQGSVLRVTGTTNLIDGAKLDWEAGQWSEADGGGTPYQSGKKVTVKNGRFAFQTSAKSIPGPDLYVLLVFAAGDQSPAVLAKYGKFGQNLHTADMYSQGEYRMFEFWAQVAR